MTLPSLRAPGRRAVAAWLPRVLLVCGAALMLSLGIAPHAQAQQPTPGQLGLPPITSPEQARELLRNRPDLVARLRQQLGASGLTPEQVRARLRASGYPENILDDYLADADTTKDAGAVAPRAFDAIRALGVVDAQEAGVLRQLDSLNTVADSTKLAADSVRRDALRADSLRFGIDSMGASNAPLRVFGLDVFRRASNRFEPTQAGPVDENYQLGPGDQLVLILTGDVERSHSLEVTREGFIVIPQVGQMNVANLTLAQLTDQLYTRLGRVYSGVKRGANPTTRFQISVSKLRNIQIFVVGDVTRPGSYVMSSAGTVLTALYAAGGPSERGSFRRVEVRRGARLIDSLDVYDYLLRGANANDIRLQSGDVVFVPVRGWQVQVAGDVVRPAIYEITPTETLRDVVATAGGFSATAFRQRVQIHRILPTNPGQEAGNARVVVEVGPDQFAGGIVPAVPMAAADSVRVFAIPNRVRQFVSVLGNVWVGGRVGYQPGMKLSEALRLAGGVKPDVYLGQVLISRLRPDSTRVQLRTAFADSTGKPTDDLVLADEDEVRVFSRTTFRPVRWVTVTGAVKRPGRVPFHDGMTARDAILTAAGLLEEASLKDAEIARVPAERGPNLVSVTLPLPLDSTYLFDRDPDGRYLGAPGVSVAAAGAPEIKLLPYDNIMIRRTPDWEMPRTVKLVGEVKYPGPYPLRSKTERLSDLIARAGGLTATAYPGGIQFFRAQDDLGRVGIDLPSVLKRPKHRDNIILAAGDSIYIPEFNPIVRVRGAVNAPGAVAYIPNGTIDDYVRAAGGYGARGDKKRAYVTQPNGKTQSVQRRFLLPDTNPFPRAGALVYVPERDPQSGGGNITGVITTIASVLASVATVLVVARQ